MVKIPFSPLAFLFDLDGTVVGSEKNYLEVICHLLEKWGHSPTKTDQEFIVGRDLFEIYDYLQKKFSLQISVGQFEKSLDAYYSSIGFKEKNKLIPGVEKFLNQIDLVKIPCAIVTNSRRNEAEQLLQFFNLKKYFSLLISANDVTATKPHPDPYLMAAQTLQVPINRCIVFEDSLVGITSAKNAGAFCIAIEAANFSLQDQSKADIKIHSFLEAYQIFQWTDFKTTDHSEET